MRKLATLLLATLACTAVVPVSASAQGLLETLQEAGITGPLNPSLYAEQCNYSNIPGIIWWGADTEMRVHRIASLAAPIYWFSPEEPLLRVPAHLPFEDSVSAPVVYYQLDEIVTIKDSVGEFTLNPDDKGQSIVSFKNTGLLRMGYFAYYPPEAEHEHDLEAVELKIAIMRSDASVLPVLTEARCEERNYVLILIRVVGLERRRGTEDWETEKRLGDPRRDLVGSAVYELRPLPPSDLGAYDEHLHRLMKSKEVVDWPKETEKNTLKGFLDWAEERGQ
jgi:hypothetical protein